MKKAIAAFVTVLLFMKGSAWAKAKKRVDEVEVVSAVDVLRHSDKFHPAFPDTSTTTCTPDREKCTTITTPGHPASVDNWEYYSHFVYIQTSYGLHLRLRYLGERVVYPPNPGHYEADIDGDKYLYLHVTFDNGRSSKLKYHIEDIWP